jgi:hypothetical protein
VTTVVVGLLLVDYPLPQGTTGIDALVATRALARGAAAGHRHHRQQPGRP